MATENQMIPFAAAKEYIQANYPNDPLLRTVAGSLLDALPKADAVEVVRCNDCKFEKECLMCIEHIGKTPITTSSHHIDFCSFGERRIDAN